VQKEYDGPEASSCEDTNIFVIKANPGASNNIPWVLFIFLSFLLILACVLGYKSWIDVVVVLGSLSNPPLLSLWLEIGC
jgi:hypothetical protein